MNHPHPPKSERIVGEWEVKQSARCPKQGEKWCGHMMRITKDQIRTYNLVSRDWVTYVLDPGTGPTSFPFPGPGGASGEAHAIVAQWTRMVMRMRGSKTGDSTIQMHRKRSGACERKQAHLSCSRPAK